MTGVSLREIAEGLADALDEAGVDLEQLVVTDNRVTLVSKRSGVRGVVVRVARRLLVVGPAVIEPVVGFVTDQPGSRKHLRAVFEQIPEDRRPRQRRRTVLRTRGRYHDLAALAEAEALEHLGTMPEVAVTWGRRNRLRAGQRSLRFGSYQAERRVVRIHPVLDHPRVPAWFIGFVIYHELLHHELGSEVKAGRRQHHSLEFRAREREHPRYDDAMRWEKANLSRLLSGKL